MAFFPTKARIFNSVPSAIAFHSASIRLRVPQTIPLQSYSSSKPPLPNCGLLTMKRLGQTPTVVRAEALEQITRSQSVEVLPELLTEFMVDMKCEGCVNSVKNKLQTVDGVKNVEVNLGNQIVRILGSSTVKTITEALEQTGRKARLIGQGTSDDFLLSAAVAEFKGPNIFGVVRFAQVSMGIVRIEANFSGLASGRHAWSINEYGDLTKGALSTGKIYNPVDSGAREPLGDLGTLNSNDKGDGFHTVVKEKLRIADLIGRSVVIYATEDKSAPGISAAVIARSARVGENYKKVCSCDGTIIWESSSNDFVPSML